MIRTRAYDRLIVFAEKMGFTPWTQKWHMQPGAANLGYGDPPFQSSGAQIPMEPHLFAQNDDWLNVEGMESLISPFPAFEEDGISLMPDLTHDSGIHLQNSQMYGDLNSALWNWTPNLPEPEHPGIHAIPPDEQLFGSDALQAGSSAEPQVANPLHWDTPMEEHLTPLPAPLASWLQRQKLPPADRYFHSQDAAGSGGQSSRS